MNGLRAFVAIVIVVAACSSYGSEDDETAAPDRDAGSDVTASNDDASTSDAGDAVDASDAGPKKCDRSKPFGVPNAVPGLTTDNNEGVARLTTDELQVFWTRYDTQWSLWTATRQKKSDPFSNALKLAGVNDVGANLDPAPTSDGLTLYFTSDRAVDADIYRSQRMSAVVAFETPAKVDAASSSADDRRPFVSPDGATLWFDSSRSGASRIYRMSLSAVGVGAPEMIDLGAQNNSVHDEHPVISDDGLALYFGARGRDDADTHVYMATRANTSSAFGNPVRVVGWPGFSAPGWITADECRLYVTIGGAFPGTRIMMVQRPE